MELRTAVIFARAICPARYPNVFPMLAPVDIPVHLSPLPIRCQFHAAAPDLQRRKAATAETLSVNLQMMFSLLKTLTKQFLPPSSRVTTARPVNTDYEWLNRSEIHESVQLDEKRPRWYDKHRCVDDQHTTRSKCHLIPRASHTTGPNSLNYSGGSPCWVVHVPVPVVSLVSVALIRIPIPLFHSTAFEGDHNL